MPTQPTSQSGAPTLGRRERKKAETRATIASSALELFLERGFDDVGIREVAAHADVAVATVFAHFPGKEALVFDEDEAVVASLVSAVEERPAEVDVLRALHDWFMASARQRRQGDPEFIRFREFVERTPALHAYWQSTWRRHKDELAAALTRTAGADSPLADLAATLVIEGYLLAADHEHTTETLDLLFQILRDGLPSIPGTAAAVPRTESSLAPAAQAIGRPPGPARA